MALDCVYPRVATNVIDGCEKGEVIVAEVANVARCVLVIESGCACVSCGGCCCGRSHHDEGDHGCCARDSCYGRGGGVRLLCLLCRGVGSRGGGGLGCAGEVSRGVAWSWCAQ